MPKQPVIQLTAEWQPIETAPKDGSWFLGYDPDSVMSWAPYEFCSWNSESGFYCQTDTSEETECAMWAPLPPPPTEYKPPYVELKVGDKLQAEGSWNVLDIEIVAVVDGVAISDKGYCFPVRFWEGNSADNQDEYGFMLDFRSWYLVR